MISPTEYPQNSTEEQGGVVRGKGIKRFIIIGLFLDVILIIVFCVWIFYSKSVSEFDMLAEEQQKVEALNVDLLNQMEVLESGLDIEYSSDVVLSISNMVLNKMEQSLFPLEFPLKGNVEGTIRIEELSSFQFVDKGKIVFRMNIIGKDLKYNPRGDSIIDNLLSGIKLNENVVLKGTGEIFFVFEEDKQRLDMRMDIRGIDFQTGLPQYFEKTIKDKFKKDLHDKPHYVDFNFKPMKVKMGDKVVWGHYHVKDVITEGNRLMAIADLRFSESKEDPDSEDDSDTKD